MSVTHTTDFVKQHSSTRDAFLGGRLAVEQPASGFRAGLDSVLLGAAVRPDASTLLDLGSGAGTAALVALAHAPDLTATLVDADAAMLALAARNLADNGFAGRARVQDFDVCGGGTARQMAGLAADHFGTVIANPPFFAAGRGTPPAPLRARARHLPAGTLEHWVRTAAACAAPGGEAIFIHVAAALPALLAACERRFGALTVLPLAPRPGAAASRILLRGRKGGRAPLTLLATRALHEPAGRGFAPEFDAIFRGRARLHW